jgi:voltage-gated potassium channel
MINEIKGDPVHDIRLKLYKLIHISSDQNRSGKAYDYLMIFAIIVSLLPLCFKQDLGAFFITDLIVTVLFVADYLMRWITADLMLKKGAKSFLLYPFTPLAIIDLLSIIPFFLPMNQGLKALRLLRLVRALRAVRFIRESRSFRVIANVLEREKNLLLSVGALALGYILLCALVIFNVEPESFENFFDAIYWACVSLTTVGYGDLYPVSVAGRFVTMLSSLVGVALIALPAGIITGGYIEEMRRDIKSQSLSS